MKFVSPPKKLRVDDCWSYKYTWKCRWKVCKELFELLQCWSLCVLKIQLALGECAFSKSGEGEEGIPVFSPRKKE